MENADRLSRTTILLHWAIAAAIIALITSGLYMSTNRTYWMFDYHKSFGILIFTVAIARVAWRIHMGWPKPVADYKKYEQVLSKIAHWVLIVATVGMPVSGMMDSGIGGHGFGVFGFELAPKNHADEQPDVAIPYHPALARAGEIIHKYFGYLLGVIVLLHAAAALKHHFFDRDGTLLRMLGKNLRRAQ